MLRLAALRLVVESVEVCRSTGHAEKDDPPGPGLDGGSLLLKASCRGSASAERVEGEGSEAASSGL